MSEIAGSVTALNIYPIKSCHAATVDGEIPVQLSVGYTGLEAHGVADRDYVLVEPQESGQPAHFVTQRGWGRNNRLDRSKQSDHRLATVRTDISASVLRVTEEHTGSFELQTDDVYTSTTRIDVDIFGKLLSEAIDQGDEAANFFSDLLSRSVRLVRANPVRPREFKPMYQRPYAVNRTAAADGYPLLLVNQSSLDASHERNGLEPGTVPISQYRGNVVLDGQADRAYDEDYWQMVKIGNLSAYVVKACQRCPIPNIDQETGRRGAGGQTVLRGRLGYINDSADKAVVFGQNLNHIYRPGVQVSVGDAVRVTSRSSKRNFTLLDEAA